MPESLHASLGKQLFFVSPLVVLGALGTLVSTITIVPHVLQAMRTRKPGGSSTAWVLGVAGSTIWALYGVVSGDLLVGAPGLVTIPCGLLLAIWSLRKDEPAEPVESLELEAPPVAAAPVYVPDDWSAANGPLEMPSVA
jgi:hypothetical protein